MNIETVQFYSKRIFRLIYLKTACAVPVKKKWQFPSNKYCEYLFNKGFFLNLQICLYKIMC